MYTLLSMSFFALAAAQCATNTLFFGSCGLGCVAPNASQIIIPASSQRAIDSPPSGDFITLYARGVTATGGRGLTTTKILLDGNAVGMGFQMRVSYDYNGDGNWDAFAVSPIIATDGAIGQYETFSHSFGPTISDLNNGVVRMEMWPTFAIASTGRLRIGAGSSIVTLPFNTVNGPANCGGAQTPVSSTTRPSTTTTRSSTIASSTTTTRSSTTTTRSTTAVAVPSTTRSSSATSSSTSTSPVTSSPTTAEAPVTPPAPAPVGLPSSVYTNAKWSSTWGTNVGNIYIPSGQRVLFDVSSLKAGVITVQQGAALVFDSNQASIDVTAAAIVVHGELWIGTASAPFQSPVNIVLSGNVDVTVDNILVGSKVIAVGNGGVIEMHGMKGLGNSWTHLARTAPRGANQITLADTSADPNNSVGWRVGDDIVVAGTDYSPDQSEKVTITKVISGNVVEISPSLQYYHHGTITMGVDERAEVGLLTRSIAIRSGTEGRIGAHVIFLRGSLTHIEGVQAAGLGQDQIGRYPFHWHMAGDQSGSYVRHSSIHDTVFRCVTLHGTHNVVVDNNVAMNSAGHCFYLEDGVERGNVFTDNLITNVREKTTGERMGSDHGTAVSGFWITSPDNTFEGNVVVGSPGAGFWVHVRMGPRGLSASDSQYSNYRPNMINLKSFLNNKGVGCDHGFQIEATHFDNYNVPQGLSPESPMGAYTPMVNGKDDPIYLDGFVAHHNRFRGLWARAPVVYVRNGKFSNNMEGIQIATSGDHPSPGSIGYIEDCLIIGWSDNIGNELFNTWQMWNGDRKRSWPRNGIPMVGVAYYDGPQVVRRNTFDGWAVDAGETPHSAVGTRFHGEFQVASTNALEDCTFRNVTYRSYVSDRNGDGGKAFNFRIPTNTMGTPKGTVLTRWPFYETANCVKDAALGLLCPQHYGQLWVIDFENRAGNSMTITRNEHTGSAHKDYELQYRGFHSAGIWRYQPLVSMGANYLVQFRSVVSGSLAFQLNNAEQGDRVGLAVCYPKGTNVRQVKVGLSNKLGGGLLPPISDSSNTPLPSLASRGALATSDGYYFDSTRGILFVNLKQRNARLDYANFCPNNGCDFVHVDAAVPSGATPVDCTADAYDSGDSIQITQGSWLASKF